MPSPIWSKSFSPDPVSDLVARSAAASSIVRALFAKTRGRKKGRRRGRQGVLKVHTLQLLSRVARLKLYTRSEAPSSAGAGGRSQEDTTEAKLIRACNLLVNGQFRSAKQAKHSFQTAFAEEKKKKTPAVINEANVARLLDLVEKIQVEDIGPARGDNFSGEAAGKEAPTPGDGSEPDADEESAQLAQPEYTVL